MVLVYAWASNWQTMKGAWSLLRCELRASSFALVDHHVTKCYHVACPLAFLVQVLRHFVVEQWQGPPLKEKTAFVVLPAEDVKVSLKPRLAKSA